jgi:hypothetical protein
MTPAQNTTAYIQGFEDGERFTKAKILQEIESDKERILQLIKELRPAISPMDGMGKGKTTHEWFDILVKNIEEKI